MSWLRVADLIKCKTINLMALFLAEDEGKQLNKRQVKIPDTIVKKLNKSKGKYGNLKSTKGYKRLNSMLDDKYNKRSDKKDRIHNNDKTLSFSAVKRIDHDIKGMNQSEDNIEYAMIGGDETRNWVHDALNRERTAVKQPKNIPQVSQKTKPNKLNTNFVKPVEPVKPSSAIKESRLIFINEEQLKMLHEYRSQLKLPFNNGQEIGHDYKENWEHFVDYLESIGHYGRLPKSEWTINNIVEAIKKESVAAFNSLYDYDYDTIGADVEEIYIAFNNCAYELQKNRDEFFHYFTNIPDEIYNEFVNSTNDLSYFLEQYGLVERGDDYGLLNFLTTDGRMYLHNALYDYFVSRYENNGVPDAFTFNDRGLIYIEREISVPSLTDVRINDRKATHEDYYEMVMKKYGGVGNCWSWSRGNGEAYCYNPYDVGTSYLLLKGWVDPKDVDWEMTLARNSYPLSYETEIFISGKVNIELDEVLVSDKHLTDLKFAGKNILNKPIIVPVEK
jgi:hypothetical protein